MSRGRILGLVAALTGAIMTLTAASAPGAAPDGPGSRSSRGGDRTGASPLKAGTYLVRLTEPPVASYTGGIRGMSATRPAAGTRLDIRSAGVRRYRTHLGVRQTALLARTGVRPLHRYTLAMNGFSAKLTAAQARTLSASASVAELVPDVARHTTLSATPGLLGLTGSSGVWSKLGGRSAAGKGIVVGVLDSGIWPENPFFAGKAVTSTTRGGVGSVYRDAEGRITVAKADGGTFTGTCQAGPRFPAETCNSKLVGARFYPDGFLASVPADQREQDEVLSPRDGDSHGSHTASTAVGNRIESMKARGRSFGASSGMAPAARLATYKVCWNAVGDANDACYTSDSIKAVDDAVADGVDVINFSVGGGSAPADDLTELAFLQAAAAGVFVAASAGNDGPDASTVDHNSPWLTTVAASTARLFEGTVKLGNGALYRGSSFNNRAVPATRAVLGSASAAAGKKAADAGLCLDGTLAASKVKDRIVVCDRGTNARVEKSAEVKRAGGVGMVLLDVDPIGTEADAHPVPTVHLPAASRKAVRSYVSGASKATIALQVGDRTGRTATVRPRLAGFSSRGPDLTSGGNLIKPDIAAPGVSVVAAVVPSFNGGFSYAPESGTSMSSPHIAGLAALILTRHPNWSPSAVKSAMMTTAGNLKKANGDPYTSPFGQGAGLVRPGRFLSPGVLYTSTVQDWLAYLEGTGVDTGSGTPPIDPSDLNLPSIGIGALTSSQTVTRRLTSTRAGTFTAKASVPGTSVKITPSRLTFAKGKEKKTFTVRITRTTATLGKYATGFLTWTEAGKGRSTRIPIAVKPVPLAAPEEIATATGPSGSQAYPVRSGTTKTSVDLTVNGLAEGSVQLGAVTPGAPDPTGTGNPSNQVYPVTIAAGTSFARFDLVAGSPTTDDLDVYLFKASDLSEPVATSATGSADERIDLDKPAAGSYVLLVNGFAAGDGSAEFTLRSFLVRAGTPDATLIATPDPLPVTVGKDSTVTLTWSGLTAGDPYLGTVRYAGSDVVTVVALN